jgi:hypothetical protein
MLAELGLVDQRDLAVLEVLNGLRDSLAGLSVNTLILRCASSTIPAEPSARTART